MRNLIRRKIVDSLAEPVPTFTRRDEHLPKVRGKAVAVIGMRRTGKTTFLWQILAERLATGTPREGLLFFSFEDERLAGLSAEHLHWVIEEYYSLHPEWRDGRPAAFFLDEVQNVPGWEKFARRLLDSEKADLFMSGSSARLLSRELATSMRGRAMEVLVHPFSFREYLRHLGREPKRAVAHLAKAERSRMEKDLREYLERGGFPETVGTDTRDRRDLLRGYVDTVILRDVIERHAVSHPVALRWLVRHLLGNAAGRFSVKRFYDDLRSQGLAVAKDTLYAYLAHLEDAFLVRIVSIATGSERRRMVNPRKIYPIDPGLIPLFDRVGRANVGHALETCVLLQLERWGADISYVRTPDSLEVDFLARYPDGKEELIQVCSESDRPEVIERESRSLLQGARQYPKAELRLITLEPELPHKLPSRIGWQSAQEWLCGDAS